MTKLKLNFKTVAIGAGIAYVGYKLYKKEPLFGKKEVVLHSTKPMDVNSNAIGRRRKSVVGGVNCVNSNGQVYNGGYGCPNGTPYEEYKGEIRH